MCSPRVIRSRGHASPAEQQSPWVLRQACHPDRHPARSVTQATPATAASQLTASFPTAHSLPHPASQGKTRKLSEYLLRRPHAARRTDGEPRRARGRPFRGRPAGSVDGLYAFRCPHQVYARSEMVQLRFYVRSFCLQERLFDILIFPPEQVPRKDTPQRPALTWELLLLGRLPSIACGSFTVPGFSQGTDRLWN